MKRFNQIYWQWNRLGSDYWFECDLTQMRAVWCVANEYLEFDPAIIPSMVAWMRLDLKTRQFDPVSDPDWPDHALLLTALEGISGEPFSGDFAFQD